MNRPSRPSSTEGSTVTEQGAAGSLRGWQRSIAPDRRTLKDDALAGLPGAIGSVPDGMAASVPAGVNPVHGVCASFAGPVGGGLARAWAEAQRGTSS